MSKKSISSLEVSEIDRIIEMAWEDRTTFTDIKNQFGIYEKDVIAIMKKKFEKVIVSDVATESERTKN